MDMSRKKCIIIEHMIISATYRSDEEGAGLIQN